ERPVREVVPVDLHRHAGRMAVDRRSLPEQVDASAHERTVEIVEVRDLLGKAAALALPADQLDREVVRERDVVAARAVERIDEGAGFADHRPAIDRPRARDLMAVLAEAEEVLDL